LPLLVPLGQIALGLALLYFGGELLVRGASDLARKAGVGPLVVGVTVVAFGTSAPELVVGITASATGQGALAIGNALGSNLFNIGIVLGVAACIRPLAIGPQMIRREALYLPLTLLVLLVLILDRRLDWWDGLVMLAVLVLLIRKSVRDGRAAAAAHPEEDRERAAISGKTRPLAMGAQIVAGLSLLLGGAWLLVLGAVDVATAAGVSARVIGLTIVAAGTSLPELLTSAIAARRGQPEIALGNVVGSNVFNVVGILGASSLAGTLAFTPAFDADFIVLAALTAMLLLFARTGGVVRSEGAALIVAYLVYLGWLLR